MEKKKILIANIGNRNLIDLSKKDSDEIYIAEKGDFRDDTKVFFDLREQDSDAYKDLKINILNTLIKYSDKNGNEVKENLEKIFLLSSNQSNPSFNQQDTYFAAKIMIDLFKRDYELDAEDIELNCSIVKPDELIPIYKEKIEELKEKYPLITHKYLICDSGGTPQQKASLKICVEYLLNREDYSFYNVVETFQVDAGIKQSQVVEATDKEYKKIIDNQQIKKLIAAGEYGSASIICANLEKGNTERNKKADILSFIRMRLNRVMDIQKLSEKPDAYFKDIPSLLDYKKKNPIGNNYSKWKDYLRKDDFFQICEILSIADFYWILKDYNNATLWFCIFMEYYLNSTISNEKDIDTNQPKFDLVNDYDNQRVNFESEINQAPTKEQIKIYLDINNNKPIFTSFPSMTAYVSLKLNSDTFQQNVLTEISKCHKRLSRNKGLYELRSDLAHRGQGIKDLNLVRQYVPDIETSIKVWKDEILDKHHKENIYIKTNKELDIILD